MRVWDPLGVSSGICGPRHVTRRTEESAESDGVLGELPTGARWAQQPGALQQRRGLGLAVHSHTLRLPRRRPCPPCLGGPSRASWGQVGARAETLPGISAVPRCPRRTLVPHREVCTAECDVPSAPGSVQEPPWLTNVSGCVCASETARASGECERAEGTIPGWPKALPRAGPQEGLRAQQGCPRGVMRHRPLHGLGASTLLHFAPQGPQEG